MKKFLATVVLGGVLLGSRIYAADVPKPLAQPGEEKRIVLADKEAAFKSTIQQFYQRLRDEMKKQSTKKQEPAKKPASNPNEPEQTGRMIWSVVNEQLKDDENKVAASVNANLVVNNGRLENMVVSGQAGLAGIASSYNFATKQNTTNLSYADKKGSRVDVTLRDCKDPVVRVTVPLRFIKGANFAGVYDSKTKDTSANIGVNHNGLSAKVIYELISDQAKTTMRIGYSPKFKSPIKGISVTRVTSRNQEYYSFDGQSKLGPVDLLVSARNNGNGKYIPVVQASGKFSF